MHYNISAGLQIICIVRVRSESDMLDGRVTVLIIICMSLLLNTPLPTYRQDIHSSVVWSENFDDRSLDGWIVTRGVFSAQLQTLWAYGTDAMYSNLAYHKCNVTIGTWSFDILLKKEWSWNYHPPTIRIMVDRIDEFTWQGYVLNFYTLSRSSGDVFALHLKKHTTSWAPLAEYQFIQPPDGWQKVDITRGSDGRITVYLNGSALIDVVDSSIESSGYFVFDTDDCAQIGINPATRSTTFVAARESPMLDNIVVTERFSADETFVPISRIAISSFLIAIALFTYTRSRSGTRGR
jgi:hypothetical protein